MGHVLYLRKGSVHTTPGKVLPAGYTKLQYIQSSGTQYINTGFNPNQNTRAVVDCQILSGNTANGQIVSAIDGTNYYLVIFLYPSNVFSTRYGTGNLQNFASSISPFDRQTIDKNKNVTTIAGATVTSTAATFSINYPLYLFARDNAGAVDNLCKMRLYSCQIYDNGTLVRDFQPCIDASGAVGLYDFVGKQFYGNAGTGAFTGSEVE